MNKTSNLPLQKELNLQVNCRTGDPCIFQGKDIFLDIQISNSGKKEIKIPLAFLQKTGPRIELKKSPSQKGVFVPTNLAPERLKDQYTSIPPGGHSMLTWVLTPADLDPLLADKNEVYAKLTLASDAIYENSKLKVEVSTTFKIVKK